MKMTYFISTCCFIRFFIYLFISVRIIFHANLCNTNLNLFISFVLKVRVFIIPNFRRSLRREVSFRFYSASACRTRALSSRMRICTPFVTRILEYAILVLISAGDVRQDSERAKWLGSNLRSESRTPRRRYRSWEVA